MSVNRRQFIENLAGLGAVALVGQTPSALPLDAPALPVSCNVYTWLTFFGREGRDWGANLDVSIREYADSGLKAFEPSFSDVKQVADLAPLLKQYRLAMPSVYIGSVLHKKEEAEASMRAFTDIVDAVRPLGTKIVVTNPTPIRWGGSENKTDAELEVQALHLDALGAALRKKGMVLAYHNHDVELRAGAREFHHMLSGTSPQNVKFCLDVHWVYRGCGNSQVALFDVIKLYGKRIAELHIRQSVDGIWSETFGAGDIDYVRLAHTLRNMGVRPHLVLEQCLEDNSVKTLSAIEATKRSYAYLEKVFGV